MGDLVFSQHFLALCCRQATCHCTRGAIHTLMEGEAELFDCGCNNTFELDLAGARRLLDKIMVSQDATIFCFSENWRSYFLDRYQLPHTST
jgi:hypothetical protein